MIPIAVINYCLKALSEPLETNCLKYIKELFLLKINLNIQIFEPRLCIKMNVYFQPNGIKCNDFQRESQKNSYYKQLMGIRNALCFL